MYAPSEKGEGQEYPPGKSVSGSLRDDNHSHKPESRDSKTISILMAGSSVNPFIGVGQICISLRRQRLGRMEADGGSAESDARLPLGRWQRVKSPARPPSRDSREINMTNYPQQ